MKKYSVMFLTILSLIFISCEKSNEEKAKDAIRTYLNENLDDMSTYEPVKFGKLDSIKIETADLKDNSLYFEMFHSYRIKESNGTKYLIKEYFLLNSKIEVFNKQPYSSKPFQLPELPAKWLVPEDTAAAE